MEHEHAIGRMLRWLAPAVALLLLSSPSAGASTQSVEEFIARAEGLAAMQAIAAQPPPGTVVAIRALLSDNGDDDGWADSNETVTMQLVLYNRTGMDLTGLVARLSTADPKIACIADPVLFVGELADREVALPADTFTFLVADVLRLDPQQLLAVTFDIAMTADQLEALPEPQRVTIDLDLDAADGSGPTFFFENFEAGLGAFTAMPIDETQNPPAEDPSNHAEGLVNADGARCQYHDPDWENSNNHGNTTYTRNCYPNPDGRPDRFWWDTTGDRAYHGGASLYFGYSPEPFTFTTPLAQLEAVETSAPIHLAWDRVCSVTRTLTCAGDEACPTDESCVETAPVLSFKHQISLMDERVFNGAGTAADRGVVQLQVAGADPAAGGDWLTLVPFWNVYDKRHHTTYINCSFDPVDDGNTEEAFFDPADPQRRFGPSSTCYPAPVFAHLGDTGAPFDPGNIGAASDGPGLEGSAGTGTWVESRFDLARFRGRSVRLRLLVSTTKVSSALTWESGFINDWGARDDGWFLDAVSVTDTLVEPASLMADTKDNSALKQDWDLDGFGATCDCNPVDETAWSLPGEARDLRLSQAGGFPGTTTLYWDPPSDPGGTTMAYGVLRATTPAGWAAAECLPLDDPGTPEAQDPTVPSAVFYYLVRAENSCGAGSPGDAVPAPQAAASCAEANR